MRIGPRACPKVQMHPSVDPAANRVRPISAVQVQFIPHPEILPRCSRQAGCEGRGGFPGGRLRTIEEASSGGRESPEFCEDCWRTAAPPLAECKHTEWTGPLFVCALPCRRTKGLCFPGARRVPQDCYQSRIKIGRRRRAQLWS